ncbi:MAG: YihY family inner membrane protein [Bacteroidetes bacterium]|nr:YihY family inner membrane protein [Bacteroidota bacterium]
MNDSNKKTKKLQDKLDRFLSYFAPLLDATDSHHTFLLSAGLAFNILLYIIPLILITIYIVSAFFYTDSLLVLIENTLIDFLPKTDYSQKIIDVVLNEIENITRRSTSVGVIGIIVLLWVSSTVTSTLNSSLNIIFNVSKQSYLYTKLKDFGSVILITIFILGYCVFLPIFNFVKQYINTIFPDFLSGVFSNIILIATPIFLSFIVFYFIYGIVPSGANNIPKKLIMQTALIATILTEFSRNLFTLYISNFANYTRFYGTFAVLIVVAVWLYYSCFLMLFSADLSLFIWSKKHAIKLKLRRLTK